ncbi:MAG: aminotransferase class V-fold PLP-dependent enzyme [Bacteroidia bacterium]|nr:aminotransferase class V-fold PLP-dependent enzyme [Bacteroidia bacterium]
MEGINNKIYFNNNRTTSPDPEVIDLMRSYVPMGNTDLALNTFKKGVASMINAEADEIIFTRGTSESINLGLKSCFRYNFEKGKHVITNISEHFAVLDGCNELKALGAEITYLPVDPEGRIDVQELRNKIRPDTQMLSIMAANNETGVVQPIEEVAEFCREHQITFFTDACQLVGKTLVDVNDFGFDCAAFGSHKMYGPEGIGALYIRDKDLRSFLLNNYTFEPELKLAAGFAKAAELFLEQHWENSSHISKLKNYMEHQLLDIEGLRINGSTRHRLYNTSNLTFPEDINVYSLLDKFDFAHNRCKESYVLKAMGLSSEEIKNSYRFSFGKYNTLDEVKLLVESILGLVNQKTLS